MTYNEIAHQVNHKGGSTLIYKEDILFNLVDDNEYLSLKPKAYKKTILDMKNIGMSAPLTLENE